MVGHELQGDDRYFGIVVGDGMPEALYFFSQGIKLDAGSIGTVRRGVGIAHNLSQQGATPLDGHRYQVHLSGLVVVPYTTARHRRNDFRPGAEVIMVLVLCVQVYFS
jgi:hypothetical protein